MDMEESITYKREETNLFVSETPTTHHKSFDRYVIRYLFAVRAYKTDCEIGNNQLFKLHMKIHAAR